MHTWASAYGSFTGMMLSGFVRVAAGISASFLFSAEQYSVCGTSVYIGSKRCAGSYDSISVIGFIHLQKETWNFFVVINVLHH